MINRAMRLVLVLLIMLVCSAFIMAAPNTAYVNGRIVYWDRCSLPGRRLMPDWPGHTASWPTLLSHRAIPCKLSCFPNGAPAQSAAAADVGTDCQYTVTATGLLGASYQASRNFIIVLPARKRCDKADRAWQMPPPDRAAQLLIHRIMLRQPHDGQYEP